MAAHYADLVRSVPNFPKPGITFLDIAPVLVDPDARERAIFDLAKGIKATQWLYRLSLQPSYIVALDARGFIFGAELASFLRLPFVMARKKGKLPPPCFQQTYALEYGTDTIELQQGLVPKGSSVLLIDDILATGGTIKAAADLCAQAGLNVTGAAFFLELTDLRPNLDFPYYSLLKR